MSRFSIRTFIVALASVAVAGCGVTSSTTRTARSHPATRTTTTPADASLASDPPKADASWPKAHPQAVQPTAGVQASSTGGSGQPSSIGGSGSEIVGDVNAHAPSLAKVKRELRQLNL